MPLPDPVGWPRRPLDGVTPLLQPTAHVLSHARGELPRLLAELSTDELWAEPAGVPSLGFQLAHLAGNIDRLFTHARGEPLTPLQHAQLIQEGQVTALRPSLADLLGRLDLVLDSALAQLQKLPPERLLETRDIGAGGAYATVFDLVSSAAEHSSRHLGQIATTVRVLRAARQGGPAA